MAENLTLARPYARAAFEFALAAHGLDSWSGKLALFAGLMDEPTIRSACRSPETSPERRADLLLELTGDSSDEAMRNFVQLLSANGRLQLLPEIHQVFERLRAEHEQTVQVHAVSAYPLTPAQIDTLRQKLEGRLKRKVQIEAGVDSKLIGGVLIHAGDKVIDGTIRGRLDRLAESILN